MEASKLSAVYYDQLYLENPDVWWISPCDTLRECHGMFDKGKIFLDLGCWQGRNALYMASLGFPVEGIDASGEAVSQLRRTAAKFWFPQVSVRCSEILDAPISRECGTVALINVISFWQKSEGYRYLSVLKERISPGTYLVITGLLKEDAFYEKNQDRLFFEPMELKNAFSGFEIPFYREDSFMEDGHEWYPYRHKHAFCRIVCRKYDGLFKTTMREPIGNPPPE